MNASCIDHKDIPNNNNKDNNENVEFLEINETIDKVEPTKKPDT